VKAEDEVLFVGCNSAPLNRRAEVVHPTKPATFTTSKEAGSRGQGPPAAHSLPLDVVSEDLVLLRCPWSPLYPGPVATA